MRYLQTQVLSQHCGLPVGLALKKALHLLHGENWRVCSWRQLGPIPALILPDDTASRHILIERLALRIAKRLVRPGRLLPQPVGRGAGYAVRYGTPACVEVGCIKASEQGEVRDAAEGLSHRGRRKVVRVGIQLPMPVDDCAHEATTIRLGGQVRRANSARERFNGLVSALHRKLIILTASTASHIATSVSSSQSRKYRSRPGSAALISAAAGRITVCSLASAAAACAGD